MVSQYPKVGGFNVDFVHSLNPQYQCPICNLALREPHQTNCGHRFCESCIKAVISEKKLCPIDKSPLSLNDVFKDAFCNREILDLLCFCQFKKVGCDWKDRLALLQKHANEDCQFVEIRCPNDGCKVVFERRYLERHVSSECRFKKQKCLHCGEAMSSELLKEHYMICPKFEEACPNGCGQAITRDVMTQHLTDQCSMVEKTCPYASCDFKGLRKDLRKHLEISNVDHSFMLVEQLNNVKTETDFVKEKITPVVQHIERLDQQVRSQNDELSNIRDNVALLRSSLDRHEKKLQVLGGKSQIVGKEILEVGALTGVAGLKEQVKNLEEKLNKVKIQSIGGGTKQQSASSVTEEMAFEKRLERMETQLTFTDIQMAEHDVKISVLEVTSYDGRYIWKIDDLGRRMNEAVNGRTLSIYSPPFYIRRFGYKACARVYLNGDGMGKGSHISLFFVIMRGNYDSLLSWPFRQKVTFKLLDQGGDQHISDSFLPDPKSSSFKRPTGNMNIASGCPLFVPKSLLTTRGYSKDNCLFFVINVDTDGLPLLYF